jgi:hypothetical protein
LGERVERIGNAEEDAAQLMQNEMSPSPWPANPFLSSCPTDAHVKSDSSLPLRLPFGIFRSGHVSSQLGKAV